MNTAAILPDRARATSRDVSFFLRQGCTWERAHVLALFESEAENGVLYATLQRESTPTAPDGTNAYACQIRLSKNPDRVVARDVVRGVTLRDDAVRLAIAKLYMRAFLAIMNEKEVASVKRVGSEVVARLSGSDPSTAIRMFVDALEPVASDSLRTALKTGIGQDGIAIQPWQAEVIARTLQWRVTCGEAEGE